MLKKHLRVHDQRSVETTALESHLESSLMLLTLHLLFELCSLSHSF